MTDGLREVSLASASPRRLQLLQSLGLRVHVIRSAYEERDEGTGDGRELALRHAKGKAALAEPVGPPVMIAADTVVDVDGTLLAKPRDAAEAAVMLRTLAGRTHVVHTGFSVIDRSDGAVQDGVESTRVSFVALSDDAIARYVATGEPMDKAGAYGIQGLGSLLVERIDGDFYTVMGLPLVRIATALRALGHEIGARA